MSSKYTENRPNEREVGVMPRNHSRQWKLLEGVMITLH